MKVALIQISANNDKNANLAKVKDFIVRAAQEKAEFIALPEVFNFRGKNPESIENSESIPDGKSTELLIELAKEHQVWISNGSIMSHPGPVPNRDTLPYNTSLLISPNGELAASYKKIHLFDVNVAGKEILESAKSQAGDKPCIAELDDHDLKIGMSICYDLRFPELYRTYAKEKVEIILAPSSFTQKTGAAHWHTLCRARAIENQAFVLAANQCGEAAGIKSYGHSLIIDPWGEILAEASEDKEEIIYADLDFDKLRKIRANLPALEHISSLLA